MIDLLDIAQQGMENLFKFWEWFSTPSLNMTAVGLGMIEPLTVFSFSAIVIIISLHVLHLIVG